ncbi:hypothetical protein ANANG_G00159820 [Anguilla anguilla]|uniref:Rho-GAP domain-containing protein n=1 Tax=Anguilla anguilla TaxID=7936 RepID=A0A9D3RWJ1_ANGAN|nr:hypothetical protein ANANG_G00159820 [Anguilla anguilla]
MPVTAALSSLPEVSPTERTAGGPAEKPGNEGQRERDKNKATRDRKMPENKQALSRSGSYLSGATYRRIKRVLSFRRRVFGQRLEETVVYERRYGEHAAPLVVEQCVAFIRERGLQEVGLFRQPGQATLVKELQDAFDAGEKPSFDSSTDVHTVASLLKLYLRELPEPVVPFSRYQDFLLCGKHILIDRKQGLLELKGLLHELPVANFNLLHYICQFLNEVQSHSSSNKMSTPNLATVFGPNILRPKAEDPESIIGGAAVVQQLMSELIREFSLLFVRERDAWPGSSPFAEGLCMDPAAQPHCSCPTPGPASEGLPCPHEQPRQGLPRAPPVKPRPAASPRRSPAPSTRPPRQPRRPSVPTATARQGCPRRAAPSAGWVEGEGRSAGAVCERGAGRATPREHPVRVRQHGRRRERRPGAYAGARDAATSADSSSWSSCELLVEDPVAGGLPSLRTDPEERRVNSPASSALTDAPSAAAAARSWQRLEFEQMARQRLEFESRIKSLEQRNEALLAEVSGLRASLEQQRRWYSVVEIKMRNAERGRADADRRNAALQSEMEQFFDTFGELGGEARKAERIVQSF